MLFDLRGLVAALNSHGLAKLRAMKRAQGRRIDLADLEGLPEE